MAGECGGHRTQHHQNHQNIALGCEPERDQVGYKKLYRPIGFHTGSQFVLQVFVTGVSGPAIRHRALYGKTDFPGVFFMGAKQCCHRVVCRRLLSQFPSDLCLNIPVEVALRLYRVHAQLVITAPELLTSAQHLIMNITAGGEQNHSQQQQTGRQR